MRQKISIESNSMNFEGRQETARREQGDVCQGEQGGGQEEKQGIPRIL